MALQKPYSLSLNGKTIDAKEENEFSWQVSGDISTAFEIKFFRNSNGALAWSLPKTTSYSTKYTIPSNSLINGVEYKAQVTIYNQANQSVTSDFVVFQTSSRPTITLIPPGTINSSSFQFQASYSQAENVPMRSWIAYLYNEEQTLIGQSPIQISTIMEYLVSNLKSETDYFIEFQATSTKGLTASTRKIKFSVLYTTPSINISLKAENRHDVAGIQLSWNVIQIIFKSEKKPLSYISNEKIDLRNNRIYADEGFSLDKNGTINIWLEKPVNEADLVRLKGANGELILQYWTRDNKFHLFKIMKGFKSHWASFPVSGSKFFVCIQQINDNCNIYAEAES